MEPREVPTGWSAREWCIKTRWVGEKYRKHVRKFNRKILNSTVLAKVHWKVLNANSFNKRLICGTCSDLARGLDDLEGL